MIVYCIPAGKALASSAVVVRIDLPVVSAFEPGRWNTASATEGLRPR